MSHLAQRTGGPERAPDFASLLIASPNPAVRRRWVRALRRRFGVYAVARWSEIERAVTAFKPAVLLLDIAIAGPGRVRRLLRFRRVSPQTKILVCTAVLNEREGVAALKAGARGYCSRNSYPALITKAVRKVLQGEIWIGRSVIPHLLKELASGTQPTEPRSDTDPDLAQRALDSLSRRQREVAQLILSGASNKNIADRLHITEATVKAHLTKIFQKLQLPDRLHVALFLARAGLPLPPERPG